MFNVKTLWYLIGHTGLGSIIERVFFGGMSLIYACDVTPIYTTSSPLMAL